MDFYKFELLRKCIDKLYNIHVDMIENNNYNYIDYVDDYDLYNELKNPEYHYNRINDRKKINKDGEYKLREFIFNHLNTKYNIDNDINNRKYLLHILSI